MKELSRRKFFLAAGLAIGGVAAAACEVPKERTTNDAPRTSTQATEQTRPTTEAELLTGKEKSAWSAFLGKEIEVPPPPQELIDTLHTAKEQGYQFDAHYFPELTISENDSYPGWNKKLGYNFWQYADNNKFNSEQGYEGQVDTTIASGWVLIDTTPAAHDIYKNDPLATIIKDARANNEVTSMDGITFDKGSRFNLTHKEIYQRILPQVAENLQLKTKQVRLPKALEYNLLTNLHYSEWDKTEPNTEWFHETTSHEDYQGEKEILAFYGNADNISFLGTADYSIGFRPMITFS